MNPSTTPPLPSHPLVSDRLARASLQAIMNAEILGVALLRGPGYVHSMVNRRYHELANVNVALGKPLSSAWPSSCAPADSLAHVIATGESVTLREMPARRPGGPWEPPAYVTITYHRVENAGEASMLLVLVEDVTERVLARERGLLLQSLVDHLLATADARSAVSGVVEKTRAALGAVAATVFVLDRTGKELRGGIGDWDWTRTSFAVKVADWPTTATALETGTPRILTPQSTRGAESGWFELRGIGTSLCVPMQIGDRSLGVLFFDFAKGHLVQSAALGFIEDVAKRCSVALARALEADPLPSDPPPAADR